MDFNIKKMIGRTVHVFASSISASTLPGDLSKSAGIRTLPSAGLGALLALMLTHQELSVVSVIGVILLIGIVKKTAIMMVDVAQELRHSQAASAQDAIRRACCACVPSLMTTGAALLGALPLAFSTGAGSELRAPVGSRWSAGCWCLKC